MRCVLYVVTFRCEYLISEVNIAGLIPVLDLGKMKPLENFSIPITNKKPTKSLFYELPV